MKNKLASSLTIVAVSLSLLSLNCKKKDDCNAGSGGNLTVVAFLEHHGRNIPNQAGHPDTVWVKYNTQNSPGSSTSAYDGYFVGEEGEDHVHCTGLKCGDYYFFATGLDTTLDTIANPHVSGGTPFSTDNESGEVDLHIAVSE